MLKLIKTRAAAHHHALSVVVLVSVTASAQPLETVVKMFLKDVVGIYHNC